MTPPEWKKELRNQIEFNDRSFPNHRDYMIGRRELALLLDDSDRCAELESRPRRPNKSQAELITDHDRAVARCADLEAALRKVDEIRHAMKDDQRVHGYAGTMKSLVVALKAPCMEIYK